MPAGYTLIPQKKIEAILLLQKGMKTIKIKITNYK